MMTTKELIQAVKNERGSDFQNCNNCEYGTHNGEVIEKLNRLAELEDKIEQGTLIELPCKVGTIVYYVASYKKKIGFWGKRKYCCGIMEIPFTLEMLDTYGNNWFLSREKAEKRLKEYKNG